MRCVHVLCNDKKLRIITFLLFIRGYKFLEKKENVKHSWHCCLGARLIWIFWFTGLRSFLWIGRIFFACLENCYSHIVKIFLFDKNQADREKSRNACKFEKKPDICDLLQWYYWFMFHWNVGCIQKAISEVNSKKLLWISIHDYCFALKCFSFDKIN